jgi:thymidylate kinase
MPSVYAIEGLDRLGKSTLIDGIKQREGFFQVIHFGKPEILKVYEEAAERWNKEFEGQGQSRNGAYLYQRASFSHSMILAQSGASIIFDRWHLGEAVYAPLYRGYSGDYVFELERVHQLNDSLVRLILLVEDFDRSKHFVSDGESFDDTKRRDEQELFVAAFNRSIILDKRMICVTARDGSFRSRDEILSEALHDR